MRRVKFSHLGKIYSLAIFLMVLLTSGQRVWTQEIPNGDEDLLWIRNLTTSGQSRWPNDIAIHPINGRIIAAINHQIWEIDPKNGNTIRIFQGGSQGGSEDLEHFRVRITSDGKYVLTDENTILYFLPSPPLQFIYYNRFTEIRPQITSNNFSENLIFSIKV